MKIIIVNKTVGMAYFSYRKLTKGDVEISLNSSRTTGVQLMPEAEAELTIHSNGFLVELQDKDDD